MIKKTIFLILIFCCFFCVIEAQNSGITGKIIKVEQNGNEILLPQLYKEESKLNKFLSENVKYPLLLVDLEMEGDMNLKVDVENSGIIKNVEILRGFDPLADERVVKAIKGLSKWEFDTAKESQSERIVVLQVLFALNDSLRNFVKEQKKNGVSLNDLDRVEEEKENQIEDKISKNSIIKNDSLNRLPEFPGGQKELDRFLQENIKYPKSALRTKLEGRVIFNVTITAEGEITNISLNKGLDYQCNEEAFFVIKKMPKWEPALKDGKAVAMQILLPIPFVLPK